MGDAKMEQEKNLPLWQRVQAEILRWRCAEQIPVVSVYTAVLFCGTVCGILCCALLGSRADGQAFWQSYRQSRAFSLYPSARDYLRSFVEWYFFYEKDILLLALCALAVPGEYLAGAFLCYKGFLLGYSCVSLCADAFSPALLVLAAGRCLLAFLLLLFCEKAVLFSRGLRAAMRHGKVPDAAQIAAFCVWFFVVSTALLLLLLAAGAAAQWL